MVLRIFGENSEPPVDALIVRGEAARQAAERSLVVLRQSLAYSQETRHWLRERKARRASELVRHMEALHR
jgi:hypothetical protein